MLKFSVLASQETDAARAAVLQFEQQRLQGLKESEQERLRKENERAMEQMRAMKEAGASTRLSLRWSWS